jgi:predicted CopG family antitoxin
MGVQMVHYMFIVKHKYNIYHDLLMSSKTITIRKEVYDELKRIKGEGESFSDLFLRLARNSNGRKLERFFGAWDIDDAEWNTIEKELGVVRRNRGDSRVNLE